MGFGEFSIAGSECAWADLCNINHFSRGPGFDFYVIIPFDSIPQSLICDFTG
jgi:hypothetical protein